MQGFRDWQVTSEDGASGEGRIVAEGAADRDLEASFITQGFRATSRSLAFILEVVGSHRRPGRELWSDFQKDGRKGKAELSLEADLF